MSEPLFIVDEKFWVERQIGHGGMGDVYLARDITLGQRRVAIKLVKVDDDEARLRFEREAHAAANLQHPNIVTIYQYGAHDDQPYIAMEFIDGDTFLTIIDEARPLPLVRKLELIEELCKGLAFAHGRGIVHRDIKPANIMVDRAGHVRILDFGIARLPKSNLTHASRTLGTLNYMSPEQITGSPLDHRCDIFAVGLVLYELLAYEKAFPGENLGIFEQILYHDPTPLDTLIPDIHPGLPLINQRALAKRPGDRYQDLNQMWSDITELRRAGVVNLHTGDTTTVVRNAAFTEPAQDDVPLESDDREQEDGPGEPVEAAGLATLDSPTVDASIHPALQVWQETPHDAPTLMGDLDVVLKQDPPPQAELEFRKSPEARPPPEPAERPSTAALPPSRPAPRRRWITGSAAVAAIAVVGGIWLFVSGGRPDERVASTSIANSPETDGAEAGATAEPPSGVDPSLMDQAAQLIAEKRYPEAITIYESMVERGAGSGEARQAIEVARQERAREVGRLVERARTARSAGSDEEAVGLFGEALELDPENGNVIRELREAERAIAEAGRAREESASSGGAASAAGDEKQSQAERVDELLQDADAHLASGRYEDASDTYDQVLTIDPANARAQQGKAEILSAPAQPDLLAALRVESPTRTVFSLAYLELGGRTGYEVTFLRTTWFFEDGTTISGDMDQDDIVGAGAENRVEPNGTQEVSIAVESDSVLKVEYTSGTRDDTGATITLSGVVEP